MYTIFYNEYIRVIILGLFIIDLIIIIRGNYNNYIFVIVVIID